MNFKITKKRFLIVFYGGVLGVFLIHLLLTLVSNVSPWRGGGFGMFSYSFGGSTIAHIHLKKEDSVFCLNEETLKKFSRNKIIYSHSTHQINKQVQKIIALSTHKYAKKIVEQWFSYRWLYNPQEKLYFIQEKDVAIPSGVTDVDFDSIQVVVYDQWSKKETFSVEVKK